MCYKVTQFICVVHMPGLRGWSGFSCGLVGAVAGRLLRSSSIVVAEVDLLAGWGVDSGWAGVLIPVGLGCRVWLGWGVDSGWAESGWAGVLIPAGLGCGWAGVLMPAGLGR